MALAIKWYYYSVCAQFTGTRFKVGIWHGGVSATPWAGGVGSASWWSVGSASWWSEHWWRTLQTLFNFKWHFYIFSPFHCRKTNWWLGLWYEGQWWIHKLGPNWAKFRTTLRLSQFCWCRCSMSKFHCGTIGNWELIEDYFNSVRHKIKVLSD